MRNEAQTRRDLIDPAIFDRGWTNDLIKVEITPGGTDIVNGKPVRRKGRSDYLLCLPSPKGGAPMPVAILEAKKEGSHASLGLHQALTYAKRFNVSFAYSSNGELFCEYAEDTKLISDPKPLSEFPTPADLHDRFENIRKLDLENSEAQAVFARYKGGESTRYYFQDAAIRAVIEKIAHGDNRALLCLATGTGKTFVAKQLLYKFAQAKQVKKALFLVDRDELRTQAITHLQSVFGDDAREVTTSSPNLNARVLIASYQTLNIRNEDSEPQFWRENFPPNTFSHIIIDECHRSAWNKWSIVLTDNPNAVQIGLTATPRRFKKMDETEDGKITAHNVQYFGEPVYEYSISQGQEDGYLAACEVIHRFVDLDAVTITKEEIKERSSHYIGSREKPKDDDLDDEYQAQKYEVKLLLDDRIDAMCQDFFDLLIQNGGAHQKTIIFCAGDNHALMVSNRLNNLYNQWCKLNGTTPKEFYAFRCTAKADADAKTTIPELKGSNESHFIACTVELLSTGVDIPNLKNVVFFKYVKSPISFYQMVGRGTRTGEPRGSKMMFRIFDYTNATRLFGEDFISAKPGESKDKTSSGEPPEKRKIIQIDKHEFTIEVQDNGCSILCDEDGKEVLVPYEEYKQRLAEKISETLNSIDELRQTWIVSSVRKDFLNQLPGGEGAVRLVRKLEDEEECDLYDIIAQLGFGAAPKSREERSGAFKLWHKSWLRQFPEPARKVLLGIAGQFAQGGIEELETKHLFDAKEVKKYGGLKVLLNIPNYQPSQIIEETKLRLLA